MTRTLVFDHDASGPVLHRESAQNGQTPDAQAPILDALPAHIALLDATGRIVFVNEAWRRFAIANVWQSSAFGVGENYLSVCDRAHGDFSREAHATAEGLRRVLSGERHHFMIEYPCHAPHEQRWFRLMATPLHSDGSGGAVTMHLDITEIVLTQESLQRSEWEQRQLVRQLETQKARLAQAQSVARICDWDMDAGTGEVAWSDEAHAMFETDAATFQPSLRGVLEFVHPDDRPRVRDAFRHSFETCSAHTMEHRALLRDGRVKVVEERWQVVPDALGKAVRAFGTCQDITERRQAEETSRLAEVRMRMAARLSRVGSWSADASTLSMVWSDEVCAIHGVSPGFTPTFEQAIAFYMPQYRNGLRKAATACMQAGIGFDLEARIVTTGGLPVWVHVICEAERDASGVIRSLQGALQDITEFKRSAEALLETEARYRRIFNEGLTANFVCDPAGRLVLCNPGFAVAYGYGSTQQALEASRLLFPDEKERQGLFQYLSSEYPDIHHERHVMRSDGQRRRVLENLVGVKDADGRLIEIQGYQLDITEKSQADEALRNFSAELETRVAARTSELEQARNDANAASQAKSAFLAAMSHEIRTPMNGVIGMLEMLHKTRLSAEQLEMSELVRDSALSLMTIIENVLDFSKIEAGKLELEIAPLDLAELVGRVCAVAEPLARHEQVEVALFIDPRMPSQVLGDATRLRQVLVNLVNNAVKFSGGSGRTGNASVRAMLVESDAHNVRVELRVIDNGIGMDQDTLARLFSPFSQADVSTTRRFGGTGLGLAITRSLLDAMGGEISVQSTLGQGSAFSVQLSLGAVQGARPVVEPDPRVEGLVCVVIGDPRGIASDFAAYLVAAGAIVRPVGDLAEAMDSEATSARGLSVWIVAPGAAAPPPEALAVAYQDDPDREVRFLIIESGNRRRPRVESARVVRVDGNVLAAPTLIDAVAIAAGHPNEDRPVTVPGAGEDTLPVALSASARTSRILVAEDNEINRKVIGRQLALLGYTAEMAASGREALDRLRSGHYDLLLTDLRMPEMDGFALASAIRAEERAQRRLPIVALTANALKSEVARCRSFGMDDYVTKPVSLARLQAVLLKWLPRGAVGVAGAAQTKGAGPARSADPRIDLRILADMVEGDPAEMETFLSDFRVSAQRTAVELRRACAAGRPVEVVMLAHRLKSSARWVGALALGDICAALEQAGQAGDTAVLADLMVRFDAELGMVESFLRQR